MRVNNMDRQSELIFPVIDYVSPEILLLPMRINEMTGILVAVVGPSGAGKDTIIDYARSRLPSDGDYHFVRRVVTRDAHGNTEDHDTMSEAEFLQAVEDSQFCMHWQAHGLYYGLPISVEDVLAQGGVVIANLSRGVLPQLAERFPRIAIAHITARPDVLAQRLAARGRETPESVAARLQRQQPVDAGNNPVWTIDNSEDVATAGETFLRYLTSCRNA